MSNQRQPKIARLLVMSLLVLGIWGCNDRQLTSSTISEEIEEDKTIANDWFYRQRVYPFERIDPQTLLSAQRTRASLVKAKKNQSYNRINEEWEFAGPTNIGGRITDVEVLPSDTETIYIGAASGGVFKTTNSGETWDAIFDDQFSLAIGDMAIAPSDEDIIYVGTGEPNGVGSYDGLGMFKSTDAGATWESIGLENVGSIGKVVIDSLNPNRVFVAAMGTYYASTPERGVYRTEDGGATWEQVLFISNNTGAIDLAYVPSQPNVIYAAMWERTKTVSGGTNGGATSGIYRSTDGGDSWEELTNGLPMDAEDKGRIGLTISPNHPDILYTIYAKANGYLNSVHKTTDAGDTWTAINENGLMSASFMWYFGKIYVHPTDTNTVYVPAFGVQKSTDGGQSWNNVFKTAHVDQHAMYIHPSDPELVFLGNDGGLYLSFQGGDNAIKINNLPITQFYACEIDHSQPERLYGGTQDNSSMRTLTSNPASWSIIHFGDGFYNLVDPVDNTYVYTESQYGNFVRSIDGGETFMPATDGIPFDDPKNWNTPVVFDPNNSSTLYFGASRVYRTTNRAVNWKAISPNLTNGSGTGGAGFGTITSMSVSPVNSKVIYVGTDDGNVWVSIDDGGNWDLLSEDLPNRWVTRVTADPFDEQKAYVTFSGFRYNSDIAHVYVTTDQGKNWTDIAGDLPDIPVNDILVINNPGELALATDIGVFFSENDGSTWELLGQELPNVAITDIDYHEPTQTLVAATYGRSMYKYSFSPSVHLNEIPSATIQASVSPNPASSQVQLQLDNLIAGKYRITLLNELGELQQSVFTGSIRTAKRSIDLDIADLPNGFYLFNIQSGQSQQTIKWMKQG